jgi:hypothetical protein
MSRFASHYAAFACVLAALVFGPAAHAADKRRETSAKPASTGSATGDGFDRFQVIVERNIFNPNRTGRTRATQEEKPRPVDEISLVGTMQYEKGLLAFFHSSDAEFRKTVRVGDSIGNFKVERISAEGVELSRDGNTVPLQVSQQLRRAEGGDWVVTSPPLPADVRGSTAGSPGAPNDSAPAEVPGEASEVLKRLLKKREKQLK